MKSIDKSPTFLLSQLLNVLVLVLASVNIAAWNTEATIFNDTKCPVQETPCECKDAKVYDSDVNDTDICEQDDICLEYLRINRQRPSNLEIIPVANISESEDTIQYEGFKYVDHCNTTGFDFAPYTNTSSPAKASYAPWRYVINRHIGRNPQDILETQCICSSCFNSARNGFNRKYLVYPIMVTRYFTLQGSGNKIFNAEFSMGCICESINY